MNGHKIILAHINTERTTKLLELNNEYIFRVERKANKYSISKAIQEVFKVKVDSVRTMVVPGKMKRVRYKAGKTSAWKKAIVRLKAGETITIFDNV